MKLKERFVFFCKFFLILLILYLLCPAHDMPQQGYYSRMRGFCAMPFYVIILFAVIIQFFIL